MDEEKNTILQQVSFNAEMFSCPAVQKILNGFYCRYQSKDYKVFKGHIELQHKPKDDEPFACYMCDFETVKTHLWINHLKTIYRCAICGEKFHAHFGTLAQNKHRGLRDYQDHTLPPRMFGVGQKVLSHLA